MMPNTMAAMAPPLGSPKHSFSTRLYCSRSLPGYCWPTVYSGAPQFVQWTAVSSFFVPHLLQ